MSGTPADRQSADHPAGNHRSGDRRSGDRRSTDRRSRDRRSAGPHTPVAAAVEEGRGPAFEDLTARARIREAALQHFADEGYERATIRGIARTAGVSPGLVRHHFGSKEALRVACDRHVSDALRGINAQLLEDPGASARLREPSRAYGRYLARALVDGSDMAAKVFDEMVAMTEQWLELADQDRPDPPTVDRRIRAALVTAMAIGVGLLDVHVSRALGTDMSTPDGDRMIALAMLDIYSHRQVSEDRAAKAGAGFDAPGADPP